jgi:stage III sporulation protein AD
MEIFKIIGIGLVATALAVILKTQRPEMSMQITIIGGTIIFILMLTKLSSVIELLNSFADKAGIETSFLRTIIKITGIAYITEFGASVCKDAGESAMATKIEFGGKIVIVALAVPIIGALLSLLISIMP